MKKVVGVIQARLGSTRLSYKMMLSLHGYPVIQWVLHRVKKSELLDYIVVAIPDTPENDFFELVIQRLGGNVFRGHENDVLQRMYLAVEPLQPTQVVRICADNPFIDGEEIDRLIDFFNDNHCDYAYNHIPKDNLYPDGLGAEIVTFDLFKHLHCTAVQPRHREHCLSYITDNSHCFNIKTFDPIDSKLHHPELKLDIDTFEDYEKLSRKIFTLEMSSIDIINRILEHS